MKKQIRIFITGALVVIPFAVTAYLAYWAGKRLYDLGAAVLPQQLQIKWLGSGLGVLLILAAVYVIGVLMHWWAFRWIVGLIERLVARLPIIKTVYEGIRDILKLFSGDAQQTGQVVRFRIPGTDIQMLGIQTSRSPRGTDDPNKVAVYLPMSYQLGGFTLYVAADSVEPIDMSVEEAMKLAATAEAGVGAGGST